MRTRPGGTLPKNYRRSSTSTTVGARQRHVREGLNEDELELFDLLKKPRAKRQTRWQSSFAASQERAATRSRSKLAPRCAINQLTVPPLCQKSKSHRIWTT